uniref:Uncharacterized protein n=1 Tax=Nelumbo nucifera TaxID=4432 RepID=A0A822Z9U1_NELNU|nr:TPA_asm: hypothetical protein HUJ06_014129 [Nelumbo nucifera]
MAKNSKAVSSFLTELYPLFYQKLQDANPTHLAPIEFATGGLGFSFQYLDQRKPGGAIS